MDNNIDWLNDLFSKEEIQKADEKLGKKDHWLQRCLQSIKTKPASESALIAIEAAQWLKEYTETIFRALNAAIGEKAALNDNTVTMSGRATAICTWFSLALQQKKIDPSISLEIPKTKGAPDG